MRTSEMISRLFILHQIENQIYVNELLIEFVVYDIVSYSLVKFKIYYVNCKRFHLIFENCEIINYFVLYVI